MILSLFLVGCLQQKSADYGFSTIEERRLNSKPLRLAAQGLDQMEAGEYAKASTSFNSALRFNPRNSGIQFFNSHNYHLRATREDASLFGLAEAGYKVSLSLDQSNWISKFYLGQLYLDQRKFLSAKRVFGELLLTRPSDPDVAFNLAVASYYSADPVTAAAAVSRLVQLEPDQERSKKIAAVVFASVNDTERSRTWFQKLDKGVGYKAVERRLKDWGDFHAYLARLSGNSTVRGSQTDKTARSSLSARPSQSDRPRAQDLNGYPFIAVRSGDTVASLSREFNITPAQLIKLNQIEDGNLLAAGRILRVPGRYRELLSPENSKRASDRIQMAQGFGPSAGGDGVGQNNALGGSLPNPFGSSTDGAPGSDPFGGSGSGQESDSSAPKGGGEPDEQKMIIVDVVIISSVEDIKTASGINLLKNLQLTFGSGESAGISYSSSDSRDFKDPSNSTDTRVIVRSLSIPAITYSLNIANSGTDRNDILARPTIVAREGETSEFFSGENIKASSVSTTAQQGATEVAQDIGVSLRVTPQTVRDDMVKLKLQVERTFLQTPSSSVTFNFQLRTTKTKVNATVDLRKGDTLILSGLSEKQTEDIRDGVPFLQEIPGIQYLFSSKKTRDYNKSVILLITPRFPEYTYRKLTKIRTKTPEPEEKSNEETSEQDKQADNRTGETDSEPEKVIKSPEINELQARYTDWFKPYPNWASAFKHLQGNKLYREFRTGDVSLEKWEAQTSHTARLKKALEFLYY
ncbi:MAG: LysM peptidoglycan-binding domain-containing protein [Rhodospirillaceae bacterium]